MGGKPGSGADGWPVCSRVQRWGLFGPLGYGWLEQRPPGPIPELKDRVGSKYKISQFLAFTGGENNPYRAQACARVPKNV